MFSYFVIFEIFLTCLLLIWFKKIIYNSGRLPPGPRGVPILGNLLQMGAKPHLKFSEWAQKFGKLFTIQLADNPALVINDVSLMKELFGMMATTGRMKTELMLMVPQGSFGLGNAEGHVWLEQKLFFLKAMKMFDFGRDVHMEPRIVLEADEFIEWIETQLNRNGSKINLDQMLSKSATNVLWSMITGERIAAHESKIVHLLDNWIKSFNVVLSSGLLFYSWIKYFAPVKSGYVEFKKTSTDVREYIQASFKAHIKSKISGLPPRDMIDAYIDKVENCTDVHSSFYGADGWKHGVGSIATIMFAGGESTGTMIHWMIYHLCVCSAVQEKLQLEIDTVIGQSSTPILMNKPNMPYMEAVILEVLRMSAVSPFGVIQGLVENINFHGYQLPKGMLLIANLYHVHYDKTIWGDPKTFRPERFLDKVNGKALRDSVVAFQPGKRTCPGERMAKDVMFLFATKLFQKFTFSVDPGVENVQDYLEPVDGYGLLPKRFSVVVKPRVANHF